jgi:hypothetical protein
MRLAATDRAGSWPCSALPGDTVSVGPEGPREYTPRIRMRASFHRDRVGFRTSPTPHVGVAARTDRRPESAHATRRPFRSFPMRPIKTDVWEDRVVGRTSVGARPATRRDHRRRNSGRSSRDGRCRAAPTGRHSWGTRSRSQTGAPRESVFVCRQRAFRGPSWVMLLTAPCQTRRSNGCAECHGTYF